MRHSIDTQSPLIRASALLTSVIFVVLMIALFVEPRPVKALPEYTSLTGESCGACHVNPGGGGPRTLRGLLWAARGKPVQLPVLPTMLLAPGVQDGYELYAVACATCHGPSGEGASAIRLRGIGISSGANRTFLLKGIAPLGMPGFKGQFTDAQVDALVAFVTDLSDSKVPLPPVTIPLASAHMRGKPTLAPTESRGN